MCFYDSKNSKEAASISARVARPRASAVLVAKVVELSRG
jgi:hypothetical protein